MSNTALGIEKAGSLQKTFSTCTVLSVLACANMSIKTSEISCFYEYSILTEAVWPVYSPCVMRIVSRVAC